MLGASRIGLKPLAQLSRRLAIATSAGLEDRRIWRDEAERGNRAQRAAAASVSAELSRGESIDDALAAAGTYFPPLFQKMAAVGDASGQLDRTYRRLAEHYEHLVAARRTFLGALAWPGFQLVIAFLTIGLVIWIAAAFSLKTIDGEPLDLFGLGLTGRRGLAVYIIVLIFFVIAGLLFVQAVNRGTLWTRRLQQAALRTPGLGGAVQTLAMARFTWALQLVLDTDMDLRKALPLALDATGHEHFRRLGPRIAQNIGRGMPLHAALAETGAFPRDLLDAISVGEQAGMLAETMQRQSKDYQERAQRAIGNLARIVGGVVWVMVALMLIVLIFRLYGQHINAINKLAAPGGGF
jgi:type IV pilus assembly protein PilC